ncbi:MAG: hypothetical protein KAI07_00905, partial [Deltaproteobacteria bacterium]|nr:hypothetical protein [Deltaproteobacteria bacterium]
MASIKTARQNVHDALILAVLDGYKHNQTFSIAWILNNLENVQGSFRVQAVVYWLEEVAGFIVD